MLAHLVYVESYKVTPSAASLESTLDGVIVTGVFTGDSWTTLNASIVILKDDTTSLDHTSLSITDIDVTYDVIVTSLSFTCDALMLKVH